MQQPFAIRLDKQLAARLDRPVGLTGRSNSLYVKQAIEAQIAVLEQLFLAHKVAQRVA